MRTDRCGELTAADAGRRVELCGWVAHHRDHGGVLFVDLRDATGIVQVVADPGTEPGDAAAHLRAEWVVRITGTVRPRPAGTENPGLATGQVEVGVESVEVLSAAQPPPFPVDDRAAEVDEVLRLRHRYLDLRSDRMQRNLRTRAVVNAAIRRSFDAQGFVEVETPMLIASTPEGARDFVVPSRLSPGSFYALPQSPQLFKQLLMVGGIDRYYQIARCLRDEDPRADRQFEFMQLDCEMSFATAGDVMEAVGRSVLDAVEAVLGERPGAIPVMSWHEAMARYGSDKPDTRFGMELIDVAPVFAATEFKAFRAESVKAIVWEGHGDLGRSRLDALTERAKGLGAAGLVWMRVRDGDVESPVAKFLADGERQALLRATDARPGDLLLLVAGEPRLVDGVLGALRLDLGRPPVDEGGLRFLWVVDFPLFEAIEGDGRPVPAHHPFTMPHPDDLDLLAAAHGEELLAVRSLAYDLVLNGWELGSGSVRIHRPDVQQQVFSLLGIGPDDAQRRFGFLLDAFRYGAPPHAGFAFGIDRLVALLRGEENIREVIAFPKTQSGADPLTGAPGPIDPEQLRELGIRVVAPPS